MIFKDGQPMSPGQAPIHEPCGAGPWRSIPSAGVVGEVLLGECCWPAVSLVITAYSIMGFCRPEKKKEEKKRMARLLRSIRGHICLARWTTDPAFLSSSRHCRVLSVCLMNPVRRKEHRQTLHGRPKISQPPPRLNGLQIPQARKGKGDTMRDAGCGGMRCKRTESCKKEPEAAREDASYPNTANRACKAARWVVVSFKSCGNASGRLL